MTAGPAVALFSKWVGKLIIDATVNTTRQGMESIAGLRYVLPYLALEFGLLLIGSLTG